MPSRMIEVTRAELTARRESVLAGLGTTREQLRERVRNGPLTASEWDVRAELEEIAFLLGDSDDI